MKKFILFLILLVSIVSRSAFAAELEYTALYVGSNKAFVNNVEKQIDVENPKTVVFAENDRAYVPVQISEIAKQGGCLNCISWEADGGGHSGRL